MSTQRRPLTAAPRFAPLRGAALGAVGGGAYWLGAQLWPTSIAVVLAMAASALVSAAMQDASPFGWAAPPSSAASPSGAAPPSGGAAAPVSAIVFTVLVKYNALMALSTASLPYPLPANLVLGLIMIAGQAASHALLVSVPATPARTESAAPTHWDLGIALALGFAPAVFIGIPGLIGLVAALAARFAFVFYRRQERSLIGPLTEICFYLGALASWSYV
jgi:cobalamin synthase